MTKKQNIKTCYKIVGRDLKSFVYTRAKMDLYEHDYKNIAVQYKKGEWVYGHNLFVFETEKAARRFVSFYNSYILYECEAVNPRPLKKIAPWNHHYTIEKILKLKKQKKKFTHLLEEPAPEGSMVCSGVKLVRRAA